MDFFKVKVILCFVFLLAKIIDHENESFQPIVFVLSVYEDRLNSTYMIFLIPLIQSNVLNK